MSAALKAMTEDIKSDAKMLAAKRQILKILQALPDHESRRRVIGAAAVMLGLASAVLKP